MDIAGDHIITYRPLQPTKFAYFSNFIRSKGVVDVIESFKIYRNTFGGSGSLVIRGAEGDITKAELERLVAHYDLSDFVEIGGPVYDEDKINFLKSFDVMVLPSRYDKECMPLTLIEGMMFGKALIALDNGAISDLISTDNGFLLSMSSTYRDIALAMYNYDEKELLHEHKSESRNLYQSRYDSSVFGTQLKDILLDGLVENTL